VFDVKLLVNVAIIIAYLIFIIMQGNINAGIVNSLMNIDQLITNQYNLKVKGKKMIE